MKALIIVYSYHHMNTEKVANAMAEVLEAEAMPPSSVDPIDIPGYDIIGFGSGIYSARFHDEMLDLSDKLVQVDDGKAFLFSTSAIMGKNKVANDHKAMREKLTSKGYSILDEFACKGYNTNSFLKYFGGMNRGRPNVEDLNNAREFALQIIEQIK